MDMFSLKQVGRFSFISFALFAKMVWPSGLRRWLKAPFRKGVGSNLIAVTFKLSQRAFYKSILHHAKPDAGSTPAVCAKNQGVQEIWGSLDGSTSGVEEFFWWRTLPAFHFSPMVRPAKLSNHSQDTTSDLKQS